MFWQTRATIDADDEEWQLLSWVWMLRNLGGIKALRHHTTLLPTHAHFPPSGLKGHDHALFVFAQVVKRFGLDSGSFELVSQEADIDPVVGSLAVVQGAPVNPLGTYSQEEHTGKHVVTYAPSLCKNLEALIATFAHEICHSILSVITEELPGGHETEEYATDLATVFYGFGVFSGNNSFRSGQFTDQATGTQGWSTSWAGYLTQNEWGFALAVRTILLEEDEDFFLKHFSSGLLINYRKNLRYLRKYPANLEGLVQV